MGLKCVAAPIRDDEGVMVAGLSVSAPTERHDPDWVAQVRQTADRISVALGHFDDPAQRLPDTAGKR